MTCAGILKNCFNKAFHTFVTNLYIVVFDVILLKFVSTSTFMTMKNNS